MATVQVVPIYQSDLLPSLVVDVLDACGSIVDLTTVVEARIYIGEDRTNLIVNGALCVIVDAEEGRLRYDWAAGQTAAPGEYLANVVLFYPGGKKQTASVFTIHILDSLH
jgi:hypothetical protein